MSTAHANGKAAFSMNAAARLQYYRRILPAYLGSGRSQLSFWHETPALNAQARNGTETFNRQLGPYYMSFREKADYAGPYDAAGVPMLDYRGAIGMQYNPIAIAQWGLANYNLFCETSDDSRLQKILNSADWLAANLEQNPHGLWVWNHHFDWEYRETLKAPWFSGLAQGQGVSLLLRAHAQTGADKYRQAAEQAFVSLTKPIAEGGVLFEDDEKNLWIEEYLVDPPTHILNGFMWALWGVFDFWLARADAPAKQIFDRGVETLLHNLPRFDTGYWSLYEQSGTQMKMLASPVYHRLHIVQLRVMANLTGEPQFGEIADRWESYAQRRGNRSRALVEKSIFKLLHY
jgi:heparosan-N-sulfate-glucuronate 5-epimerase